MHELPQRHRITVEHFYRMAEVGVFARDERVELIEGEIIDVPPMGVPHAGVLDYLAKLLMRTVEPQAIVRSQLPLRLGEYSEPLPDLVIAKHRADLYMEGHPTGDDALLDPFLQLRGDPPGLFAGGELQEADDPVDPLEGIERRLRLRVRDRLGPQLIEPGVDLPCETPHRRQRDEPSKGAPGDHGPEYAPARPGVTSAGARA